MDTEPGFILEATGTAGKKLFPDDFVSCRRARGGWLSATGSTTCRDKHTAGQGVERAQKG